MNLLKKTVILIMFIGILLVSGCGTYTINAGTNTPPEITIMNEGYSIAKKGRPFAFYVTIYDPDINPVYIDYEVIGDDSWEDEDLADWDLTDEDLSGKTTHDGTDTIKVSGLAFKIGVFEGAICASDGKKKGIVCKPWTLEVQPACLVDEDCLYDVHNLGEGQYGCLKRTCVNPNTNEAECIIEDTVFNTCEYYQSCSQLSESFANCTDVGYQCCHDSIDLLTGEPDYPCTFCD